MMNREQRRKYQKQIKNDKAACICPKCNYLSRFYSKTIGKYNVALVCDICQAEVRTGEKISQIVPPGIYLPFTLSDFDKMLAIAEVVEKKKQEEEQTNAESEGC